MNTLIVLPATYERRYIRSEESYMINTCHPERNPTHTGFMCGVESKDPLSGEAVPMRGQGAPADGLPSIYGDASTKLSMTGVVGKEEIGIPHRNSLIARVPSIRGDKLSITGFDERNDNEVQPLQNQLSHRYSYQANKELS